MQQSYLKKNVGRPKVGKVQERQRILKSKKDPKTGKLKKTKKTKKTKKATRATRAKRAKKAKADSTKVLLSQEDLVLNVSLLEIRVGRKHQAVIPELGSPWEQRK